MGISVRMRIKSQIIAWSTVSVLISAVLSAGGVAIFEEQLLETISHYFTLGQTEVSEEFLKKYLDSTSKQVDSIIKSSQTELNIIANLAQSIVDEGEAPNSLPKARSFPGLVFQPQKNWWQNSPGSSSITVFGHMLEPGGAIPNAALAHLELTERLVPVMNAVYNAGAKKQWIYAVGPPGISYIRVVPWTNIGTNFEAKYPGQNKKDVWDFYFPGLVPFWNSLSVASRSRPDDGLVVIPPYIDAAASGIVASMFRPIWSKDRQSFNGALAIDLNLNEITLLIKSIEVAESGFAFLANSNRQIIAIAEHGQKVLGLPDATAEKTAGVADVFFDLKDHPVDSIRTIADPRTQATTFAQITLPTGDGSRRYFLATKKLPSMRILVNGQVLSSQWALGIMVPRRELFVSLTKINEAINKEARFFTVVLGVIFVGLLFFTCLLGQLLSVNITARIRELAKFVKRLPSEGYGIRTKDTAKDEIGELSQAFNEMADEIQIQQSKLMASEQSANAASQAKSEFLATMTHEIKTPLTSILSAAHLLSDGQLSAKQKKLVNIQEKASKSLLSVISSVLDFSRIEAGQLEVETKNFDLIELVTNSVEVVRLQAAEKGLSIGVVVGSGAQQDVFGDEEHLSQILINLLGNAVKYTEQGSITVSIETTLTAPHKVRAKIVVKDTGVGISQDNIAIIFDRFKQGDQFITRKYGGAGLGLAICKQLTEIIGGSLGVTSTPGVGSEFCLTVELELRRNGESLHVNESAIAHDGSTIAGETATDISNPEMPLLAGLRILLAEDNPDTQFLIKMILEVEGVEVHCVANGKEAVDIFPDAQFDAVIMDLQMPVMSGYDAIRNIRGQEATTGRAPVPIIALTAHTSQDDEAKTREVGATLHMRKPFNRNELLQVLRGIVKSKPAAT